MNLVAELTRGVSAGPLSQAHSLPVLGVLGGMGPLATADFLRKLAIHNGAERDQDHIPVIAVSIPQIPDRTDAILARGADPLPAMATVLRALEDMGATFVAIPCNTAHHWYDALRAKTDLPIIHIVDAVAGALIEAGIPDGPVGIIATDGTIASGIYAKNLERHGFETMPAVDQASVMEGIRLAKAGHLGDASRLLSKEIISFQQRGCRRVILGCTEIPVALAEGRYDMQGCIDATGALADACLRFAREAVAATDGTPSAAVTTVSQIEGGGF